MVNFYCKTKQKIFFLSISIYVLYHRSPLPENFFSLFVLRRHLCCKFSNILVSKSRGSDKKQVLCNARNIFTNIFQRLSDIFTSYCTEGEEKKCGGIVFHRKFTSIPRHLGAVRRIYFEIKVIRRERRLSWDYSGETSFLKQTRIQVSRRSQHRPINFQNRLTESKFNFRDLPRNFSWKLSEFPL